MAGGCPEPTAPAMSQEPTWLTADPVPQLLPCPGNKHGRQQRQAHSSRHAPGTNMAGGSLKPTGPAMLQEPTWPPGSTRPTDSAMPREPTWPTAVPGPNAPTMLRELTWPAAASGSRIRACPGNQHGCLAAPGPQLPPSSENQHGEQQNLANSSCNAPGANMAGGSPGPTSPPMPLEPKWPTAIPGSMLPPCPKN